MRKAVYRHEYHRASAVSTYKGGRDKCMDVWSDG